MTPASAPSAPHGNFIASRKAPIAPFSSALRAASVYAATPKAAGETQAPQSRISSPLPPDESSNQPMELLPWETTIELPKETEIAEALKLAPSDAQGSLENLLSYLERDTYYIQTENFYGSPTPIKRLFSGKEFGLFSILLCVLALYKISTNEKQKYWDKWHEEFKFLSDHFQNNEIDPQKELCYKIFLYNLSIEQQNLGIGNPELDKLKDRINRLRSQFNPLPIEIIENEETKKYRQLHETLDTLFGKNKDPLPYGLPQSYIQISEHIGNDPKNPDERLIKARCLLGRARDESLMNKISDALEYLSSMESEIGKIPDMEYQFCLFERLITILKEIPKINHQQDTKARVEACRQQIKTREREYTTQIQSKTESLQQLSKTLISYREVAPLDKHLETLFNALKETVRWTTEICPSAKREFFTAANSVLNDLKMAYVVKLGQKPHSLIEKLLHYCDAKLAKIPRASVRPISKGEQQQNSSENRLMYLALAIIGGLILYSAIAVWRRRSIVQLKN